MLFYSKEKKEKIKKASSELRILYEFFSIHCYSHRYVSSSLKSKHHLNNIPLQIEETTQSVLNEEICRLV